MSYLALLGLHFLSLFLDRGDKAIHPAEAQTVLVTFRADMLLSAIGSLRRGEIQFIQSML